MTRINLSIPSNILATESNAENVRYRGNSRLEPHHMSQRHVGSRDLDIGDEFAFMTPISLSIPSNISATESNAEENVSYRGNSRLEPHHANQQYGGSRGQNISFGDEFANMTLISLSTPSNISSAELNREENIRHSVDANHRDQQRSENVDSNIFSESEYEPLSGDMTHSSHLLASHFSNAEERRPNISAALNSDVRRVNFGIPGRRTYFGTNFRVVDRLRNRNFRQRNLANEFEDLDLFPQHLG